MALYAAIEISQYRLVFGILQVLAVHGQQQPVSVSLEMLLGTMMEYVKIASIMDFRIKKVRSYSLLGRKVAVIRRNDGSFHAIEAACKHQGADLTTGEIRGHIAICPKHQWMYDLESGECLNHDSLPLRKYGIRVEGDSILVSLYPVSGEDI